MAEGMSGLNLVLLGKTGVGKSASGNTILGREAFISKKSSTSVTQDVTAESGTVDGLPVTVYDTPGLCNTHMSDEEIIHIYAKVLQRCESGLCVFLLVIKAYRFTEEEREAVEKIEKLLGEERLKKTWILFTGGDELEEENMTIKEFINDNQRLKNLVQKYDQRYHVFDNKRRGNTEQFKMLHMKICRPKTCLHTMDPGDQPRTERQQTMAENLRHRRNNAEVPLQNNGNINIVLLGKTGVGKSSSGNTILGDNRFTCGRSLSAVTKTSSVESAEINGRSVSVIDTPGFFCPNLSQEQLSREFARSVYLAAPGVHVFLLVVPFGKFTEQEEESLTKVQKVYGKDVLKHVIILFTYWDECERERMQEEINENTFLKRVVDKCRDYHVINNRDLTDRGQVNDLLTKIDTMIEWNQGYYTNEMYECAQMWPWEKFWKILKDIKF